MEAGIKIYKKRFDRDLRHVKIILARERRQMSVNEWLGLVDQTKECIANFPEDFFCGELPSRQVYCAAIEKVFDGFLEDQRLLAVQTSKGFKIPTRRKE